MPFYNNIYIPEQTETNEPQKEIKIAGFDFDDTLCIRRVTKKRPCMGWEGKIFDTLQELSNNGYTIVIFSNQGSIAHKKKADVEKCIQKIQERFTSFIDSMKHLSMYCLYAPAYDICRKPALGMLKKLESSLYPTTIDYSKSFFVGDAAGRKGDFSCTDRMFAINANMSFKTPEHLFLGTPEPTNYHIPIYNIPHVSTDEEFIEKTNLQKILDMFHNDIENNIPIAVASIGFPGSGKTYLFQFLRKYLKKKYPKLNVSNVSKDMNGRDFEYVLKRMCLKCNVVLIDNTHPTREDRNKIRNSCDTNIHKSLRQRHMYFIEMDTTREQSEYLNRVRSLKTGTMISPIVYNIYNKKKVPYTQSSNEVYFRVPIVLLGTENDPDFQLLL